MRLSALTLLLLVIGSAAQAQASGTVPFLIEGDRIPHAIDGLTGDISRGRAIVINRQKGLCLLCHTGPFAEERQQGNLAPSLAGAGSRSTVGQLRLKIVNSQRLNVQSIMPAYYETEALIRVAPALRGKPILTAQEIEDVVAFIMTLKE
jgi:L-cysteine S-thiosulfotransferase